MTLKKAYVEEWVFQVTDTSERSNSESQGDVIPETPKVSMPVSWSPWRPTKNRDTACSWERIEAPLPPLQPQSTCDRLESPFSCDACLSGYEDLVSSGSDHFTMWCTMSPQEILVKTWLTFTKLWHISVKLMKEDRLHLLRHMASTNTFLLNHLCRGGSASTTGTLGPDEERRMLRETNGGEVWHLVILQEASDCVEHEILHERFHVTHFAGCAILFNKDTFYPDISVKSIYLHDTRWRVQDHIVEGEHGWVLQHVLSHASFRPTTVSGQNFFTVLSQQHLRQEERHRQEALPHHPCHYDFSRS